VQKVQNLHNWISELPEEIQGEVGRHFVSRKLVDGEYLYHQGDPPDACFQVANGRCKVCNYNYDGQEILHTYIMAGDCVGDWGLLIDQPRMNSTISVGSSEVNVLRKTHFNNLYDRFPEIARALNRVMARRLRLTFMLTEDASLLPLRPRLARVIIRMGYSLGYLDQEGCTVIEGISQDELSKMVGATRPSVGRELKKLEREGSIGIRYGKLIIKDLAFFSEQYHRLTAVEPVVPDYESR
jgi:CRP/FNR family cyclic AMP-dependent transcriptional regulator